MVVKTKYEALTSFPFWGNKKGAFVSALQGNYTVKITKK